MKKHNYRRFSLSMAMLLTACLSFGTAHAEPVSERTPKAWYEISEDIIIVHLPADNADGCEWDYELSNPDLLELLSVEYAENERPEENAIPEDADFTEKAFEEALPEELSDGALRANRPGETYIASFQAAEGQTGDCTLTLSYFGEQEDSEPLRTCILNLTISAEGEISVVSAEQSGGEFHLEAPEETPEETE